MTRIQVTPPPDPTLSELADEAGEEGGVVMEGGEAEADVGDESEDESEDEDVPLGKVTLLGA